MGILFRKLWSRTGGVGAWAGLSWLRIGTGGELLWTRQWTFVSHKMRVISWPAERLLASPEGLCSVEVLAWSSAPAWSPCSVGVRACMQLTRVWRALFPVSCDKSWKGIWVKACDYHASVVYFCAYLTSFVDGSDSMTSNGIMVNGNNAQGRCCGVIEGTVQQAPAILALHLCNII
jgi:hypothetical protein